MREKPRLSKKHRFERSHHNLFLYSSLGEDYCVVLLGDTLTPHLAYHSKALLAFTCGGMPRHRGRWTVGGGGIEDIN
jgi:hypothetical protein